MCRFEVEAVFFHLSYSLESYPAEFDNLLAGDVDEKWTTAVVFGFQLISGQQPVW